MPPFRNRNFLTQPVELGVRLIKRFGLAGFWVAAGRLAFLILVAVAGRLASPDDFGLFMVALAASQILSIFATMGTGGASQFFVARALAKGQDAQVPAYVRFAVFVSIIGTGGLALILCLVGYVTSHWSGGAKIERICSAAAAFTLVMAPSLLREMLARSFRAISLALVPRDIMWTLGLATMLVFSKFARDHLVILGVISLGMVEMVAWILLWNGYLRRFGPIARRSRRPYRQWVARSLATMGSNAGGVAFERVDTLTVGFLASLPLAGAYGAASRIAPLVSISNRFVAPIIFTRLAALVAARNIPALRDEVKHAVIVSLLSALPLFILIQIFAGDIVSLVGSPREVDDILRILAVGNLFTAIGVSFGALVQMGNSPWLYTRCIWLWLIVTALVLPFAYWRFGIDGAAMTVAVGMIAYSSSFAFMARSNLGYDRKSRIQYEIEN